VNDIAFCTVHAMYRTCKGQCICKSFIGIATLKDCKDIHEKIYKSHKTLKCDPNIYFMDAIVAKIQSVFIPDSAPVTTTE
jgi:hypothetical protein